jgi:acyl-CoA thioester hydrolase
MPDPSGTLREGAHHYDLRVYYEDTDAGGVVYHANYLRFAERARTESLRDLGVPHADMARDHGLMFMVRRVKLDYLEPARLEDSLVVVTRPMAIGGASIELSQTVLRRGGPTLVRLEIQLVCVGVADQRARRLPLRWREALRDLVV